MKADFHRLLTSIEIFTMPFTGFVFRCSGSARGFVPTSVRLYAFGDPPCNRRGRIHRDDGHSSKRRSSMRRSRHGSFPESSGRRFTVLDCGQRGANSVPSAVWPTVAAALPAAARSSSSAALRGPPPRGEAAHAQPWQLSRRRAGRGAALIVRGAVLRLRTAGPPRRHWRRGCRDRHEVSP